MLRIQNEKKEDFFLVHEESHDVKCSSSLPRSKEVHQEDNGESESPKKLFYGDPRGPWLSCQPSMMQESNSQFQGYAHPSQSTRNTPFPWKPWPSQP